MEHDPRLNAYAKEQVKKKSKAAKVGNESNLRKTPKLVNHHLLHPSGANRWHRLYDSALCEVIPSLYEGGKSDAEVAVAIGIAKCTFYAWRKKYPEFNAAVMFGKTIEEVPFQEAGREAALGQRDINGRVWEVNMRNRFGYDQPKDITDENNDADKEANINKATAEKLAGKMSDY